MSHCPTASNAMEHDTARRLESMDSSSRAHPSQDSARLDAPRHDAPRRDLLQFRKPAAIEHGSLDHGAREQGSHGGLHDTGRLIQQRTIVMAATAGSADGCADAEDDCDDASADVPALSRTPDPARDPAREALERTCLTVKRIALDIGMPRATLEAYRLGTRRMPQAARVRLGTYLASHAAMLDGLAQALIAPPSVADA